MSILFVAGNAYGDGTTKFSVVRYGNVVGSRGSIVEKLIKSRNAHTVHITDERMTRFWIDLEQAFEIVLFGLTNMEGGETFIPKAPTMKLSDLFDIIVPDAKRNVMGIRPGEKLHEILLTTEESRHAVELDEYYVILPENASEATKERLIKFTEKGKNLEAGFHFSSNSGLREMTKEELLKIVDKIEQLIS